MLDEKLLRKSLGFPDKGEFYLKYLFSGNLLKENPFTFEENMLLNCKGVRSDAILCDIIRGKIVVDAINDFVPKVEERYFYFNITKTGIDKAERRNDGMMIDMFNIIVGNTYQSLDDMTDEEESRIQQLCTMFQEHGMILFPKSLKNPRKSFHEIREITFEPDEPEKGMFSTIFSPVEKKKQNLHGVLERAAQESLTNKDSPMSDKTNCDSFPRPLIVPNPMSHPMKNSDILLAALDESLPEDEDPQFEDPQFIEEPKKMDDVILVEKSSAPQKASKKHKE